MSSASLRMQNIQSAGVLASAGRTGDSSGLPGSFSLVKTLTAALVTALRSGGIGGSGASDSLTEAQPLTVAASNSANVDRVGAITVRYPLMVHPTGGAGGRRWQRTGRGSTVQRLRFCARSRRLGLWLRTFDTANGRRAR